MNELLKHRGLGKTLCLAVLTTLAVSCAKNDQKNIEWVEIRKAEVQCAHESWSGNGQATVGKLNLKESTFAMSIEPALSQSGQETGYATGTVNFAIQDSYSIAKKAAPLTFSGSLVDWANHTQTENEFNFTFESDANPDQVVELHSVKVKGRWDVTVKALTYRENSMSVAKECNLGRVNFAE